MTTGTGEVNAKYAGPAASTGSCVASDRHRCRHRVIRYPDLETLENRREGWPTPSAYGVLVGRLCAVTGPRLASRRRSRRS